jgi:hypothetical protein
VPSQHNHPQDVRRSQVILPRPVGRGLSLSRRRAPLSGGTARGAIHQLLSIIFKLRILVLVPVSTMPYVVTVQNYS